MQKTFSNYSPSTGKKICDVEITQNYEIESAIQKAKIGFKIWKNRSGFERA